MERKSVPTVFKRWIPGLSIPVTKHSFRVDNVTLRKQFERLFRLAKSGRPGPVLVDIPKNIQLDKTEYAPKGISEKNNRHKAGYSFIRSGIGNDKRK